jgi:hypothetical protein
MEYNAVSSDDVCMGTNTKDTSLGVIDASP